MVKIVVALLGDISITLHKFPSCELQGFQMLAVMNLVGKFDVRSLDVFWCQKSEEDFKRAPSCNGCER